MNPTIQRPPAPAPRARTSTPTIRDVARLAGVSLATVSRSMNGAPNVSSETRERVLEAARQLRFVPSGAARSLIMRRTDTIGVVLPDLHGAYFSELIRGIDQAAHTRGLHMLLSSAHGEAAETARVLQTLRGRVDGLIVMGPGTQTGELMQHLPQSAPVVLLQSQAAVEAPNLGIDNEGGALQMTRHLLAQGRRRIAFVCGPAGHAEAAARLAGFRSGLAEAGLDPEAGVVLEGDFSERSGAIAAHALLDAAERPDAVFCANDAMAIGCLETFAEAHVRVPGDIAVVGFDDAPVARFASPPLTTVRAPIAALGLAAFEVLMQRIQHPHASTAQSTRILPVDLIVRRSCGAAPAAPDRPA